MCVGLDASLTNTGIIPASSRLLITSSVVEFCKGGTERGREEGEGRGREREGEVVGGRNGKRKEWKGQSESERKSITIHLSQGKCTWTTSVHKTVHASWEQA